MCKAIVRIAWPRSEIDLCLTDKEACRAIVELAKATEKIKKVLGGKVMGVWEIRDK